MVRASSIFPILSAVLLLLGGVCVAASRLRRARTSLVLGAGILFVAAGQWGPPRPPGSRGGVPGPSQDPSAGREGPLGRGCPPGSQWGSLGGVP